MPRFDSTGPYGAGPATGRGLGPCGQGMACGRGFGIGMGYRRFYTQKEEGELLKDEQAMLEKELTAIKERLAEISGKK